MNYRHSSSLLLLIVGVILGLGLGLLALSSDLSGQRLAAHLYTDKFLLTQLFLLATFASLIFSALTIGLARGIYLLFCHDE